MKAVAMRPARRALLALLAGGMLLAGCSSSKKEALHPVQGNVMLGTSALTTGTVVFHADAEQGNTTPHEPRGVIENGQYDLHTAGKRGAPPGWYRVTVLAQKKPVNPNDPYSVPEWLVPAAYINAKATPLRVEVVKDAASAAYDLIVK